MLILMLMLLGVKSYLHCILIIGRGIGSTVLLGLEELEILLFGHLDGEHQALHGGFGCLRGLGGVRLRMRRLARCGLNRGDAGSLCWFRFG